GDGLGIEAVPPGHLLNTLGVVVGHEEVAGQAATDAKQLLVVQFVVLVQPPPGPLACRGVRGVDEEHGILPRRVVAHYLHPVALHDGDALPHTAYLQATSAKGWGIPPRLDAFAILAVFDEAAAVGHDSAMTDPILENGLERPFAGFLGRAG